MVPQCLPHLCPSLLYSLGWWFGCWSASWLLTQRVPLEESGLETWCHMWSVQRFGLGQGLQKIKEGPGKHCKS